VPAIYEERLTALQFPAHCHVRAILRSPHNLLNENDPATNAAKRRMLEMATTNIFEYGRRNRWSWSIMPNPGNKAKFSIAMIRRLQIAMPDGIPQTPLGGQRTASEYIDIPGWGLMAGHTKWDNCGGFNSSLVFLARHVFNFQGVETAAISGDFLTAPLPGGTIDSYYQPTVRTFGKSYDQVNLYFFTGHEFVKFDNYYFDVTANKVFQQAARYTLAGQRSEEKYCDLRKVTDANVKNRFQNATVFEVLNDDAVINGTVAMPGARRKYLVQLVDNKYNHWAGYLLTAQAGLSQQTLDKFREMGPAIMREDPNELPYGQNVRFKLGKVWGVNQEVV